MAYELYAAVAFYLGDPPEKIIKVIAELAVLQGSMKLYSVYGDGSGMNTMKFLIQPVVEGTSG